MIIGKNTIAKATALINSGTHMGSFVAPLFFGWALDLTGSTKLGLYVCAAAFLLNFVIMNAFFITYKARQADLARGNGADQ
jgi:nitrate/nitrite transporter NarK